MTQLQVQTRGGALAFLDRQTLDPLAGGPGTQVLLPGAPEYDEARAVWNAMIDRRPALIARCASAEGVAEAVRFAAGHDLLLAVRGGGHNIAGNAVCDDGLMIDLSPLREVVVDADRRTVKVGGGATLGDVDAATQVHGLATPLGINSTTGIAGLTLGGGFGWTSRSLGLTSDNLLSADVVLADGSQVKASEVENADLFWAIRGGGGNFGVVTTFEFRLHPVGPEVLSGLVVHPLAEGREVLRYYAEFSAGLPDEMAVWFVIRKAPPLPFLAEEWHGKEIVALAACYNGPMEEGERLLKPLRAFGKPIADVIGPHPFVEWQKLLDPMLTPGERNYWKSQDFLSVSDGLIDTLLDYGARIPDPQTEMGFAQLGGAINRVPVDATAFSRRDANYLINLHGRWSDPAKDMECIDWARGLCRDLEPYATGAVYVNFLTQDEQERVRAAYGSNYEPLTRIKAKYDPTNLFRMNQNIRPAG